MLSALARNHNSYNGTKQGGQLTSENNQMLKPKLLHKNGKPMHYMWLFWMTSTVAY